MFDLIGFDADDTLWHNETLFMAAQQKFYHLLEKYSPEDKSARILGQIETCNLDYFGFGVTGFAFSMIEAAIELSGGRISGQEIQEIVGIGKWMLDAPLELFDHVQETLDNLSRRYTLMLITKGELLNQQRKLDRSGLGACFRYVEILNKKTRDDYASILAKVQIEPSRFIMVGNSLKSDILPVVELGGYGVHIPFTYTWVHEQVPEPQAGEKRYAELERIDQLPDLLERLQICPEN
jgi:putative hydrolase of the HAD superfamily